MARRRPPRRAVSPDPDYRFTVANEPTFLAWTRAAPALVAGAVTLAGRVTDIGLAVIDEVSARGGVGHARRGPRSVLPARVAPGSTLPDLVRSADAGSRRLELAVALLKGSRLQIAARGRRFEGSPVWASRLVARPDTEPGADAATARALVCASAPSREWVPGLRRSRSAHDGTRGWPRPNPHRHTVRSDNVIGQPGATVDTEARTRTGVGLRSPWRSMRRPRWRAVSGDVVAGVSVAMVGVPQSLAYADLAGMDPVVGLYAGAVPPILAALFASSPYLQTGPVAITALLTFGALSTMATPGSPEYLSLGLALALVVGVVRVLLGVIRAGWLAYLMSQPMLLGFVPAAAVLIAGSQTSKALGVPPPPFENEIVDGLWSLVHPGLWSLPAVAVSAMTAVVILGGRRLHALFPGVLVAAVLGIVISAVGLYPGPIVETIPSGFPPFTLLAIPWDRVPVLLLSGVLIALIGFTEAASIARRFASEDRTRWSADREFVSQGVANLAAAAFGGMPCGGSFSRSSVNRMSGAVTRLSGGVTGLVVLAFLPFATVLEPLPLAVLGAIVVVAVLNLLRFGPLFRIWRVSVPQAVIAWGTFIATVLLAPRLDLAVLIGVGLSVVVFLWRSLQLDIDVEVDGSTLIFTPRGVLWFGTAQRLDTVLIDSLAAHPEADRLVVDLARLGRIDTTGALVLRSVLDQARVAGLRAEAVGIPPQSQRLTERVLNSEKDPLG